jgi:hypothetical protein
MRRRRWPAELGENRALLTCKTLGRVETGGTAASFDIYAKVLSGFGAAVSSGQWGRVRRAAIRGLERGKRDGAVA